MNSDDICRKISIQLFQDITFDNDISTHSGNREILEGLLKLLVIAIKDEIVEEDIKSLQTITNHMTDPYDASKRI
jgi:hypothetical protein